ncbi:MAG: cytochrome P450 [Caldilineaceae bacterium]
MQSLLTPIATQPAPSLPPEVKGWPWVGALPALIRNPIAFLTKAREWYGDLYTLNLGFAKVVVCNHPRHAQHILRDHIDNYGKDGAFWASVRGLFGNGLLTSEGEFWRRQRRLMQPHFHRQRLATLLTVMVDAIDESLDGWQTTVNEHTPFDLMPAAADLTMRVVVNALFGTALSADELAEVGRNMAFALDYMTVNAATQSLPAWAPVPGRRRYRQAIAQIDAAIYRIIAASRQATDGGDHLLGMLLNSVDEETGERMDDRQLRDEIFTLFLAGYETTSIALVWAFAYLTTHPTVMAKLQAEVDKVLDERDPDAPITFVDLPKLTYTRQVLQEILRLRPPSYWSQRTAVADDEMDGYRIPAGTMVVWLTYMIHHHPALWPDPEHFDPDRFAPQADGSARPTRHPFAWMPFGVGQRICIGRDFALMEGTLALAMIVRRFQVRAVADHVPQLGLSTTLRPKAGVRVHLSSR